VIENLHKSRKTFDVIFFDPPYRFDLAKKTLQTLEAYDILSPNGLIIVQRFKNEELPQEMPGLVLVKEAKYGDTRLSIFQKKE
jgi:16S rRNA G966 N2-methylase RsmD